MADVKPRVYWKYYPKLMRGYWRVSHMPRTRSAAVYRLWDAAHRAVDKVNWTAK